MTVSMILDRAIEAFRPFNFRGKLRLLDGVVPHSGEVTSTVFGFQVELDLSEAIQRWIYMGAFEPAETSLVQSWLQPGMTFVDVGANVGYFTLMAAARVGSKGAVHAIEPSPYAFNRLSSAAAANSIVQIHLHNVGLSTTEGELTLYVQPRTAGFHSPSMSSAGGGDPVTVPVLRLEDAFERWGVGTVDLMKMDVEGHEMHVLEGAGEILSSGRIRAILIEFNEHWLQSQGSSSDRVYTRLIEAGFVDQEKAPEFGPTSFETRFLIHHSVPAGERKIG